MLESLQTILLNYGYIGLFLASFLASTILPFGSEGILVFLVYEKFNIPALVLVASIGNYFGACTTYYMGLKGRGFAEKYLSIDPGNLEKAEKIFSKYGVAVLLFTWLPGLGFMRAAVDTCAFLTYTSPKAGDASRMMITGAGMIMC